jgi:tetratricopeptide (TPR) repeat protein
LGSFYELSYQYDRATAEYQKAIAAGDTKAFNNLARVELLNNNPALALRIIDDAIASPFEENADKETQAALLKNKAWAENALGFLPEAEVDAKRSLAMCANFAPAYCVLGKTLQQEGRVHDAVQTWKSFLSSLNSKCQGQKLPSSEPDCILLAERATHE